MGEILCRILENPRMPGSTAKKVGEIEAPRLSRLPWWTKPPPVSVLRMANGAAAREFAMPGVGTHFQGELNRNGNRIWVVRSNVVLKPPLWNCVTVMESSGSAVSVLGILKVLEERPVESRSATWIRSGSLKPPIRNGVSRSKLDTRELPVRSVVSTSPGPAGVNSVPRGVLKL